MDQVAAVSLSRSLCVGDLGAGRRSEVKDGSIALYYRLKPRDTFESLCAQAIVALNNAIMEGYATAAWPAPGLVDTLLS